MSQQTKQNKNPKQPYEAIDLNTHEKNLAFVNFM